jgi:Rrf2 family iron-sulfur cluster assembly transcriptional regulator
VAAAAQDRKTMRLSTKGRYAVMAMTDLAVHTGQDGRAVSLADIAGRQEISQAYLEQLFARLRRAGLVKSVRGPGGGYRLAKPAGETRIAEIVLAADEPIRATRCSAEKPGVGCMPGGAQCLTHGLWDALGRHIEHYLSGVSLEDVIQRRFDPPRTTQQPQVAA